MDTFTISSFPTINDFENKVDDRIKPFLKDWQLKTIYEGTTVDIPGHSNSSFDPVKYFQVVKKPGESFYREDERDNEIGLTLWAHWPGYDHECEVNLFIAGKGVLDRNNYRINAEILKAGGATMKLYFKNKLITDFTQKSWFRLVPKDKVWINDMKPFLN